MSNSRPLAPDIAELAPGRRRNHAQEKAIERLADHARLAEPGVVRGALVLDHGGVIKVEAPAIAHRATGSPIVLHKQVGREVHALNSGEPKLLQSIEPVSPAAEELDDFRIARPGGGAELGEPFAKFADLLLGGLDAKIGLFPRVIARNTRRGNMLETGPFAKGLRVCNGPTAESPLAPDSDGVDQAWEQPLR